MAAVSTLPEKAVPLRLVKVALLVNFQSLTDSIGHSQGCRVSIKMLIFNKIVIEAYLSR